LVLKNLKRLAKNTIKLNSDKNLLKVVTSETWETDTCDSPFTNTPTEPGEMSVKNVEEKDE